MNGQAWLRDATSIASRYGFHYARRTGKGHLKFTHPMGVSVVTSATPSDYRVSKNFESQCRRTVRGR